jgi:hypothetical protein
MLNSCSLSFAMGRAAASVIDAEHSQGDVGHSQRMIVWVAG